MGKDLLEYMVLMFPIYTHLGSNVVVFGVNM